MISRVAVTGAPIHLILTFNGYKSCSVVGPVMITRSIYLVGVACGLAMLCAAGCGSGGPEMVPIRGEVTYKGAPLRDVTRGIVRYSPEQSGTGAREASGRIQPDGSFELTTFKKADGVVVGEYDITVSAYSSPPPSRQQTESGVRVAGPKLMIPERYLKANTSGLSDNVDANHSGYKKIELTD